MNVNPDEFFRQSTVRICSSLDIDAALERMRGYISRFIPIEFISLLVFDPSHYIFQSIAGSICETAEGLQKSLHLPLDPELQSRWMRRYLGFEQMTVVNDIKKDEDLFELSHRLGFKTDFSYIIIRLELEGNRIGGLWISKSGKNQYTQEQGELLYILREPISIAMSNALRHREILEKNNELLDDIRYLHNRIREKAFDEIVGSDLGLKKVMDMVNQVADLDSPVLITGETGVGKEMIANAVHFTSNRKNGPFIKVNCGAIPETLMDSELFGHEKGSFTGATATKIGRFERADNGSIFLDEIGELSPQAQVRLLRVLQEKKIERVGGTREISVDVRVIFATHRNLQKMVANGEFREDLWFRLNVFPIDIPPLRERKEDIPALVGHFLRSKSRELKLKKCPDIQMDELNLLLSHDWPGNVRELQNLIERALIRYRYKGGRLSFQDLLEKQYPAECTEHISGGHADIPTLDEIMGRHIQSVLAHTKGKISGPGGAAEILGVPYSTLRHKMTKLHVPFGKNKKLK